MSALHRDFSGTTPVVAQKFLMSLQRMSDLTVEASPSVATHIASVDGLPHVFFANFTGLDILLRALARSFYFLPANQQQAFLQSITEQIQ
jgi:hypothetical protein